MPTQAHDFTCLPHNYHKAKKAIQNLVDIADDNEGIRITAMYMESDGSLHENMDICLDLAHGCTLSLYGLQGIGHDTNYWIKAYTKEDYPGIIVAEIVTEKGMIALRNHIA